MRLTYSNRQLRQHHSRTIGAHLYQLRSLVQYDAEPQLFLACDTSPYEIGAVLSCCQKIECSAEQQLLLQVEHCLQLKETILSPREKPSPSPGVWSEDSPSSSMIYYHRRPHATEKIKIPTVLNIVGMSTINKPVPLLLYDDQVLSSYFTSFLLETAFKQEVLGINGNIQPCTFLSVLTRTKASFFMETIHRSDNQECTKWWCGLR